MEGGPSSRGSIFLRERILFYENGLTLFLSLILGFPFVDMFNFCISFVNFELPQRLYVGD